jgi:hypothetical protein
MAARIAIPPELIAFMRSAENLGLLARRTFSCRSFFGKKQRTFEMASSI